MKRSITIPLLTAVLVCGAALYTFRASHNPPGFFVDESSIAYNAHTISQTGRDEFGEAWPLFFRAFGEHKNPIYVYLLAGLFKVTGPSILTARLLSAFAGVVAATLIGLLAFRVSRRSDVGLLVAASALLTPWLFEMSHVALEVSLYPLIVALFLLCVRQASTKAEWSRRNVAYLALSLALLTYTYSIGRLLGPLLAVGLVIFASRERMSGIIRVWGLYALTLLPLIVFQHRHAEALTGRFRLVSYIKPDSSIARIVWEFVKHYAGNLDPRRLFVTGDPDIYQVAHVHGTPAMLAATMLLVIFGVWLVLKYQRSDSWWRFILYGLAASIVPASLTIDYFHMLRLAAMPVFLLVLTVPAFAWLCEEPRRRSALLIVASLTLLQGAFFQWQYQASERSSWRRHLFDADYPEKLLPTALAASSSNPIYIADSPPVPGYIQALWYGVVDRLPQNKFVILAAEVPVPENAVVITTESGGPRCNWLAGREPYTVCVEQSPPRVPARLPESGFRAEINVPTPPLRLSRGESSTIAVVVKNVGDTAWLARERVHSPFQLSLGNHWLDRDGNVVINDNGRATLLRDLRPGEVAQISLVINAPTRAGDYLLEIDMLQEGVSWFGLKGSRTWRGTVRVE
ncbi:MAG TPA: hypothetical protein VHD88_05810 [Pyrinomonadaceae bacterium]|nr:hypothetical protein [Pyrinomonadaceae bacterium]